MTGASPAPFDDCATPTRAEVERGYALYCPNTGTFAWKDECDAD